MKSKLSALFAFVCLIGVAAAQEREVMRGPIHGRVTDASGRPVPGAQVVLEPIGNTGGGRQARTTSSKGEYRFDELPEGNYRLTFRGISERPVIKEVALRRIVTGGGGEHSIIGPETHPPNARVNLRNDIVAVSRPVTTKIRPVKVRPSPTPLITTLPPDDPPKVNPTPAVTPTPKPIATPSPRVNPTRTPHDTQSTNTQSSNTSVQVFPTATPGGSEATNTAGTSANPSPPGALTDVERQIQEMKKAAIAFNVPEAMSYEEVRRIKLVLSPSKSEDEVAGMVQEPGHIERASVRYAPLMEARLTGAGFDVDPVTKERQLVISVDETVWEWDVKALKVGKQRLNLTMDAILTVSDDSKEMRNFGTFRRDIYIEVSWSRRVMDFGANNWQWLWAAIGIPAATWFWSYRRKKGTSGGEVVKRRGRLRMRGKVKF